MILLTALVSVLSEESAITRGELITPLAVDGPSFTMTGSSVGTGKEAPVFIKVVSRNPLTRNAPEPITVNPEPPARNIDQLIRLASLRYGVDHDLLLRVARCESKFNPAAVNKTSGASGLYQHLATTWRANSVHFGWAGSSVFDAEASVNVAAAMIAGGNIGAWDASRRCWE